MVLDPPTKPHQVPDLRQRDVRVTQTSTTAVTGTLYVSIPACAFHGVNPDTDQITYGEPLSDGEEKVVVNADAVFLMTPVNLPNGAVVTECIVYGNAAATAETWALLRKTISADTAAAMAGANIDTADTTITNPTIDNATYAYLLATSSFDTNDELHGARIKYTLQ